MNKIDGLHLANYPEGHYVRAIAIPDELIRNSVDNQLPVKVAKA